MHACDHSSLSAAQFTIIYKSGPCAAPKHTETENTGGTCSDDSVIGVQKREHSTADNKMEFNSRSKIEFCKTGATSS